MNWMFVKWRNMNRIRRILLIVSTCAFIYSAVMLTCRFADNYQSKKTYDQIGKIYSKSQQNNTEEQDFPSDKIHTDNDALEQIAREKKEEERLVAFKSIQKINKDAAGYIIINNTNINYPVVQGKDNDYYLTHDINNKSSSHGTIFMDVGNNVKSAISLEGQNIVLYGHSMKDMSMLAGLKDFRQKTFFEDNPYIQFDILGQKHEWEIFSVYIVDADFNYRQTSFKTSSQFNDFIKSIEKKSIQYRELNLTPKDTILTLSTCAYDFENARLVVQAKLIS